MKITATIQARMGSSRLPGKVLKPIMGRPMLALQIERIQQSLLIDEVIIATSTSKQDDPLEALARDLHIPCYRGSEDDVLGRIVGALKEYDVHLHAEFMGDNPIPDPLLIDEIIGYYLKYNNCYDYVTNGLKTTYPPGAEVFVYPAAVLYDAEKQADPTIREHVGPHIYQHPERYRIHNIEAPQWLHAPHVHLEVDTQEDFELIAALYEHFYPRSSCFGLQQVLQFVQEHPSLCEKNKHVERRWKAFRNE